MNVCTGDSLFCVDCSTVFVKFHDLAAPLALPVVPAFS